jgi:hypothetical protein
VETTVDDFFDLVMLLIVNYLRKRRSSVSTIEGIMRS